MDTRVTRAASDARGMRRYYAVATVLAAIFLATFLIAEQADLGVGNPRPWLKNGGAAAGALGVGLLIADVALPVPSSLVTVAHGALFEVAVGTLLSLMGSVGAAAVAFAIGRTGGPLLERLVGQDGRRRADALLQRWGVLAIVVSRPVPILAETVALLAGASPLPWRRAVFAAAVGSLPATPVYAITGAIAASFPSAAIVFGLVLAAAAALRWLGRHRPSVVEATRS